MTAATPTHPTVERTAEQVALDDLAAAIDALIALDYDRGDLLDAVEQHADARGLENYR